MLLIFLLTVQIASAQSTPPQTPRVAVVFVEYSDAATNSLARGSVGYDGNGNIIENKYRYHDYHDFFFKENGYIVHPDSASHSSEWTGAYKLGLPGSLREWVRENSYGEHEMQVAEHSGAYSGILNDIAEVDGDTTTENHRIVWVRINKTKAECAAQSLLDSAQYGGRWGTIRLWTNLFIDATFGTSFYNSVDILIYVFAGRSFCSAQETLDKNITKGWPIAICLSEKTANMDETGEHDIFQFSFAAVCHEYCHAAHLKYLGETRDFYTWKSKGKMGFGPFSGQYEERQQTPMHLDPWNKLRLKWLHPNFINSTTNNLDLHVIESPDNGSRPDVAIIPLSVPLNWENGDNTDWTKGHYLIVENRRADGFDRFITAVPPTGTIAQSNGGFLVWDFDEALYSPWTNPPRTGLALVEADGGHHADYGGSLVTYTDLFSVNQNVSTWSKPPLLSADPYSLTNFLDPYTMTKNKQLSIEFDDYDATSSLVNTIPKIELYTPTTNNPEALKGNGQRKLALSSDETKACMVSVSEYDASNQGMLFAHLSTDAGASWGDCYLLNRMTMMASGSVNIRMTDPASAPSVVWFDENEAGDNQFHVVWQELTNSTSGLYNVRTCIPGEDVVTIATGVDPGTGRTPSPVIAFANGTAKIVYCGGSGLYEMISTDNGATWNNASLISGTSSISVHPSLAKTARNEVLVYQEPDGNHFGHLYSIINSGQSTEFIIPEDQAFDHQSPCVTIQKASSGSEVAHLVWEAKKQEWDEQNHNKITHQKIAHTTYELPNVPTSLVKTFFNKKYERNESSVEPSITPIPGGSDIHEAAVMWSVTDPGAGEGARLRFSKFEPEVVNGASILKWWDQDVESILSSDVTRCPSIVGIGHDARYLVTMGNATPRSLVTNLLSNDPGITAYPMEISTEFSIATNSSQTNWPVKLIVTRPALMENQQLLDKIPNAGIPMTGFDGSVNGPTLASLATSAPFRLTCQQVVEWEMRYVRDSSWTPTDTVLIYGTFLDKNTYGRIGCSGDFRIAPGVVDTTFIVGLELPIGYCPSDSVRVSVEASGDLFSDSDANRFISVLMNRFAEFDMPKLPSRERSETIVQPGGIDVFPQPARDILSFSYMTTGATKVTVELYNDQGKCVRTITRQHSNEGRQFLKFDTASLPTGTYFYKVRMDGRLQTGKANIVR